MGYSLATEREALMREIQAKYDQEVFSLFPGRSAPRYLEGENPELYRKRLASMALAYAPGLKDQNIKMDDARGAGLRARQAVGAVSEPCERWRNRVIHCPSISTVLPNRTVTSDRGPWYPSSS